MVHHLKMKAYSIDLREKIIAAVRRGMSKAQAARTFGVGATSVKRYVKLAEEGKPLSPRAKRLVRRVSSLVVG
jgi:transposase